MLSWITGNVKMLLGLASAMLVLCLGAAIVYLQQTKIHRLDFQISQLVETTKTQELVIADYEKQLEAKVALATKLQKELADYSQSRIKTALEKNKGKEGKVSGLDATTNAVVIRDLNALADQLRK